MAVTAGVADNKKPADGAGFGGGLAAVMGRDRSG